MIKVDNVSQQSLKNAKKQEKKLSLEANTVLDNIVDSLKKGSTVKVLEVTPVWFILSHSEHEHSIQLQVDSVGSNLDILAVMPNDNHVRFPDGSMNNAFSKLVFGNENFSKQRVLAFFNLHDRATSDSSSEYEREKKINHIYWNDKVWESLKIDLELEYNK